MAVERKKLPQRCVHPSVVSITDVLNEHHGLTHRGFVQNPTEIYNVVKSDLPKLGHCRMTVIALLIQLVVAIAINEAEVMVSKA